MQLKTAKRAINSQRQRKEKRGEPPEGADTEKMLYVEVRY